MEKLTIAEAKRLNDTMVTEDHLKLHAANVAACMGAMADHFGADKEHWEAVGYLHDYDYEKYPEEHLAHTEEPLRAEGVPEEDIRAILSHGYSICTDVEPISDMEKSLFTVDELSGIVQAAARMRPNGIVDMSLKSFMKKWKDKRFAAGCNREIILKGCGMLGMDIRDVAEICIRGMQEHAEELGLAGCMTILALWAFVFARGICTAARRAADAPAEALLATGIVASLAVQLVLNVAGVLNALPMTGITLPLISLGGSSQATVLLMCGVLAGVSGARAAPRSRASRNSNGSAGE